MAIIKDDHDHEFYYEDRHVPLLANIDRERFVVCIGTLSKSSFSVSD